MVVLEGRILEQVLAIILLGGSKKKGKRRCLHVCMLSVQIKRWVWRGESSAYVHVMYVRACVCEVCVCTRARVECECVSVCVYVCVCVCVCDSSDSNWILMSCQPHRVTSGLSNAGHKQIHISKLFSHIYQPSVKSVYKIYKTNHFANIKHTYTNNRYHFSKS